MEGFPGWLLFIAEPPFSVVSRQCLDGESDVSSSLDPAGPAACRRACDLVPTARTRCYDSSSARRWKRVVAKAPTGKTQLNLARGNLHCSLQDAGRAVGGYAFAEAEMRATWPRKNPGTKPTVKTRARWSAEIYDFQPASKGSGLNYQDLIVTIGLSSRISEKAIAGMLAIVEDVNAELRNIPSGTTFWGLPSADHAAAPVDSVLWRMWRSVEILEFVPGVAHAVSHKTLHHKRPELFPLLDNKTIEKYLPYPSSWQIIHSDLTNYASEFTALEKWFAGEAAQRGRIGITRLRMYDIILWLRAATNRETGRPQWHDAVAAGTKLGF